MFVLVKPQNIDNIIARLRKLVAEGHTEELLAEVATLLTEMATQNNELQLRLARFLRHSFGRKSEKINSNQLEFFLSQLTPAQEAPKPLVQELPKPAPKPRKGHGRRPLPKELPREEFVVKADDKERQCNQCGNTKSVIGYEKSEILEFVPASFKVLVPCREKLVCRTCEEGVVIAPVQSKVIDAGLPGTGLLSHVVISKYKDGLPLNRLSGIYKRSGVDLAVSTLAGWVAAATSALEPIANIILQNALDSHVLQTDDTGLRVLDDSHPAGIKRGHVWVYLGDSRWAAFVYTPDWSAEGPRALLESRQGWLMHDAYKGYDMLHGEDKPAIEVACWAHGRRGFEEALSGGDFRAAIPIDYIRKLFSVESAATTACVGHEERLRRRNEYSKSIVETFQKWMLETIPNEPPKSPLAKAIAYFINRWQAFTRFLEDGRLPLENNASERALRAIAVGRKAYLFAGSDEGARRAAIAYTILGTCGLCGVEPWAYLNDVFRKLADGWLSRHIEELLPNNWLLAQKAQQESAASAAAATTARVAAAGA